jgi:hypothetical protein
LSTRFADVYGENPKYSRAGFEGVLIKTLLSLIT